MIKVHMGLFSYALEGEREEAAALDLQKRIDYLDRLPGVRYYADDLASIRQSICDTYHVKIRVI